MAEEPEALSLGMARDSPRRAAGGSLARRMVRHSCALYEWPRGLPRSWDEIAAGHLVIAQESLQYGWWEAIVLARNGDTFTLQYRDYPHLPKFVRHRSGIALMCPNDEAKPAVPPEQV